MKRGVLKKASGAVSGGAVILALAGAVGIHAEGADTSLPPEYIQYCEEAGQTYSICPELLEAVIEAESSMELGAVSKYLAVLPSNILSSTSSREGIGN